MKFLYQLSMMCTFLYMGRCRSSACPTVRVVDVGILLTLPMNAALLCNFMELKYKLKYKYTLNADLAY